MRSKLILVAVSSLVLFACYDAKPTGAPATTTSGALDYQQAPAPRSGTYNATQPGHPIDPELNRPPQFGGTYAGAGDTTTWNPPPPDMRENVKVDPDLKLVQDVRKALTDTSGLSVSAKTVFIDANGGRVTLRGEVANEEEHARVVNTAKKYAGEGRVEDQLTVAK